MTVVFSELRERVAQRYGSEGKLRGRFEGSKQAADPSSFEKGYEVTSEAL